MGLPAGLSAPLSSPFLQRRELGHEAGGVSAETSPQSGSGKAQEPGESCVQMGLTTVWVKLSNCLICDCRRVQGLSVHSDASASVSQALRSPLPPGEPSLAVGGGGRFPLFGEGCPSVLSYMDESGLEQEEGKSEVTCM